MSWNERYVAFARVHGREPDAQLASDEQHWPGGRMAGFIVWMNAQWRTEAKVRAFGPHHVLSEADHRAFDARLAQLPPCTGCGACTMFGS